MITTYYIIHNTVWMIILHLIQAYRGRPGITSWELPGCLMGGCRCITSLGWGNKKVELVLTGNFMRTLSFSLFFLQYVYLQICLDLDINSFSHLKLTYLYKSPFCKYNAIQGQDKAIDEIYYHKKQTNIIIFYQYFQFAALPWS